MDQFISFHQTREEDLEEEGAQTRGCLLLFLRVDCRLRGLVPVGSWWPTLLRYPVNRVSQYGLIPRSLAQVWL